MPTDSRYICDIHDDIDAAVKKGRIDLIAGLTEEARVAGKRMEAKLHEYANMKYNIIKYSKLKKKRQELQAHVDNLEDFLGVEEGTPDPELLMDIMED